MAKLFILLCILPAVFSQCSIERSRPLLKRSAYEFAIDLTTRIAQDKEYHFVASTFSLWTLLATASLGATGATLEELRTVLKLHKQRCFNDKYFEMIRSIKGDDVNVTLFRSSNIFVAEGFSIVDVFKQRVNQTGVSSFQVLPFTFPEETASIINNYVSQATGNTINDLVMPSDLDGINLVLIDAIFFKGIWQNPFPYENTEPRPFYDDSGVEIGEVTMMTTTGTFNVTSVGLIDANVLELPFGTDGRFVMLVFLPRYNTTLSAVMHSLRDVSLATIYSIFSQELMQTALVQLPKFDMISDLDNLKELLMDMGLRRVFDSSLAEFTDLAEDQLFLSNIIQKASVEVNEEGAVATAASAGFLESRSGPLQFIVNKPFFYMIVDTATQVPLFTGAYSKPS